MSFIDMKANDVWTDADIDNRVQAIIRSQVSETDELKALRLKSQETISAEDQAFIDNVDGAIAAAIEEGRAAKADMALLAKTLVYEKAMNVVAHADAEVVELAATRNQAPPEQ